MLQFKLSTQIRVPVRLLSAIGTPVPLVTNAGVTVTIEKADGTTTNFSPSGAQWIEVTTGAFLNQGKYDLIIPSSFTDQVGAFVYAVGASGANTYMGAVRIITYETADLFNESALATPQTDFDSWKTDWTTARANKLDNLTVNNNTLATASALAAVQSTVNTLATSSSLATLQSAVTAQGITLTTVLSNTALLLSYTRGTWVIFDSGADMNKMVFYDESGTVIAKFNLQDDVGNPVSIDPFKRIRIPGSGYGA